EREGRRKREGKRDIWGFKKEAGKVGRTWWGMRHHQCTDCICSHWNKWIKNERKVRSGDRLHHNI
ncbi:hypothetical protein ACQP3F_34490, partial [Escherichia coli]